MISRSTHNRWSSLILDCVLGTTGTKAIVVPAHASIFPIVLNDTGDLPGPISGDRDRAAPVAETGAFHPFAKVRIDARLALAEFNAISGNGGPEDLVGQN